MNRFLPLATLTAAALTVSTPADIVESSWTSPFVFDYEIVHIPDFDQRRAGPSPCITPVPSGGPIQGLPNDGRAYCVPTAVTNLFAYMANHGFDSINPGYGNHQSQSMYEEVNETIDCLGLLMGTSPTGGTGGSGKMAGTLSWLGSQPFAVTNYFRTTTWMPTHVTMAEAAINGALVQYSYGRYNFLATDPPILSRDGGHAVTLARVARNGFFSALECRNPGGQNTPYTTQSLFANTMHTPALFQVRFGDAPSVVRTVTWLVTDLQADPRYRVLDSYMTIKPEAGYTFTEFGIHVLNPWIPDGPGGITTLPNTATDTDILGFALHPDHVGAYWYDNDEGVNSVWFVSELTAEHEFVYSTSGLRDIAVDRFRRVVLGRDLEIRRIVPGADPLIPSTIAIPDRLTAIACDDDRDEIVVLSGPGHSMGTVRNAGHGILTDYMDDAVPAGFPLFNQADIAISPLGDRYVAIDTDDCIQILRRSQQGWQLDTICDPAMVDPEGLCFSNTGQLLVSLADESVLTFKAEADELNWALSEDSVWSELTGRGICVSASRTNYDPAQHDGPEWRHLDPAELWEFPEVLDCPGDITGDGDVNVDDLLRLLSVWGTDEQIADIAPLNVGNNDVDVDDLLLLLSYWGPCP